MPALAAAVAVSAAVVAIAFFFAAQGAGTCGTHPAVPCSCCTAAAPELPATPVHLPGVCPPAGSMARTGTAVPEYHDSSDLAVYRPEAGELVPYTDRGFSEPTEAAVAWWMAPGFIANTSDFRAYERANGSAQASYPEEYRVFFTFVQAGLDDAEQQSVLRDNLVLYRGIGPGLAGSILATGEYREPAFASTSYDIALSLDAFGPRSPDGYRTVLVLGRGIGQHALYVNEDEREFLIPRDTRWQLTRALDVGNLTVTGNFALHGQTGTTARYDHVRLLYMTEETCT